MTRLVRILAIVAISLVACGGDDDDVAAAGNSAEAFCTAAPEGLDGEEIADATEELAPDEVAADAAVVADALREVDGDISAIDDEAVAAAAAHLNDFCAEQGFGGAPARGPGMSRPNAADSCSTARTWCGQAVTP